MKIRFTLSQSFWISVTTALLALTISLVTDSFATSDNAYNIFRNASFIALIALGQAVVIIGGGIDLSVGSVMALAGVVTGVTLQAGAPLYLGVGAGLGAALLAGLTNGLLIAYAKLSPFVVTLGMLSVARSLAIVISGNQMIFEFGPDQEFFLRWGTFELGGLPAPLMVMTCAALVIGYFLKFSSWGLAVFAIGGNESAAERNGLSVPRVKVSGYLISALCAGVAAILSTSWLGSVTNALGNGYELTVVAAAVIGGVSLQGGSGGVYGAIVGAFLIEVIRNGLLLAGVDPYWQGCFVGVFIVVAVLLGRLRREEG
jgi:ribose transport system permease protein